MSLPVSDVIQILRDEGLITEVAKLQAIAKALDKAEREAKQDRKGQSKGKTRLTALIRGDESLKALVAGGTFVLAVPEDETLADTYAGDGLIGRLRTAVARYNDAPVRGRSRKRKVAIETWTQAFSTLKAKAIKDSGSAFSIRGKGLPIEVVVLTSETVNPSNP